MTQATKSTPTFNHNGVPGLVHARTARATGTVIELVHVEQYGMAGDTTWALVCQHATVNPHTKYKMALADMARPQAWCEQCAAAMDAKGETPAPAQPKQPAKVKVQAAEKVAFVTPAEDGGWDVTVSGKHIGTYSSKSNANRKARKVADRIADTTE